MLFPDLVTNKMTGDPIIIILSVLCLLGCF
jgi:hypothetical protein